ncbi:hypothetical protein [Bradyrhizobium sp. SZCCHNR1051]|uniref:hypothetical protein n=1 Tax=Bradyrhizobium sp. SZCCHNR1051 TaxID=3057355 RepID=UPI002916A13F|nr:hypothetical protein [Bradyrhizobium sp. SZCCHNR1051]
MSYNAKVFRILIASPSDVGEEREIAVDTIQAWNDLNSSERQIVLLPLRWETHSSPEFGHRPQEVINRQVVDHCDLLVGIFWTRVGSPTGAADSGTVEEIERVAQQGKPVMLYFSQAKQDPGTIDLEQLRRLREFKGKTFPRALVEHFSNQIEFRDKLWRQLEIQIRTLLAEENKSGNNVNLSSRTEIQFGFADPSSGKLVGSEMDLKTTSINVSGIEELPNHGESADPTKTSTGLLSGLFEDNNKDYYRKMAKYLVTENLFRPIRFWLKNSGGVGARDIYVDIRISMKDSQLLALPFAEIQRPTPRRSETSIIWHPTFLDKRSQVEEIGNLKVTRLELPALQPQREISPEATVMIGARHSGLVSVEARIYADSLPEPVSHTLQINWTVQEVSLTAHQLLEQSGITLRK